MCEGVDWFHLAQDRDQWQHWTSPNEGVSTSSAIVEVITYTLNFSGRYVSSNEKFNHNTLFHSPRYLLFAHYSSNSQTGLNRF
jgi:hypothetical protein